MRKHIHVYFGTLGCVSVCVHLTKHNGYLHQCSSKVATKDALKDALNNA